MTGALHVLYLQLSPPLPSSLVPIKPANPGSPGKMAVKTERDLTLIHNWHCTHLMFLVRIKTELKNYRSSATLVQWLV